MSEIRDRIFEVSSMGRLYRKSLNMFACYLEDNKGNKIHLDNLSVDQPFFVFFKSGTGITRTSAVRVV